jgi:KEOPS complex subunit Pcc1
VTSKKSTCSNHDAILAFEYDDAERARRVERAVRPEIGDIDGDRSTASLAREGATLELTIEAADLVALRAGLNTWCTLVSVAEQAGGAAD